MPSSLLPVVPYFFLGIPSSLPRFAFCSSRDISSDNPYIENAIHPYMLYAYEYFHRHKAYKDGLRSQCKGCQKKYREKNRKRILAKKKEYREKNKERLAAKKKAWDLSLI